MTNQEITDALSAVNVFKTRLAIYVKNHMPNLYKAVLDNTSFLDENATFAERLYCIRHGISERPICPVCKTNVLKFKTDVGKYAGSCSTSCSRKNPETMAKLKNTLSKKEDPYGTLKSRQTRLDKYGAWHSADFYEKCKTVLMEKYGDPCWNNAEKRQRTCIEKYGVDHHMKNAEMKKRHAEKFAKEHNGIAYAFQLPEVRAKTYAGIRRRAWTQIKADRHVEPIFTKDEFMKIPDINSENALKFRCTECGTVFDSWWDNGRTRPCPKCCPVNHGTSKEEIELAESLKKLVPDAEVLRKTKINRQVIPPKEIDIIVRIDGKPVLGVEFDGLYWHSDEYKSRMSHIDKTAACEKAGLKLVHVFESEWIANRELVISRLANILGIHSRVLYARKCEIKPVDAKTAQTFLNRYHSQGFVPSGVNLGLYSESELVALMTFGKCRFDKKHEWEMLRFCCKAGTRVTGGAGKLLKHFEKTYSPKSLVSYADIRWSSGDLYRKLGFDFIRKSPPNYWYFKHNSMILESRIRY